MELLDGEAPDNVYDLIDTPTESRLRYQGGGSDNEKGTIVKQIRRTSKSCLYFRDHMVQEEKQAYCQAWVQVQGLSQISKRPGPGA